MAREGIFLRMGKKDGPLHSEIEKRALDAGVSLSKYCKLVLMKHVISGGRITR